jgi:RNA-directed DNA polymerase
LRDRFFTLQSRGDVARLLDVRLMDVIYYAVRHRNPYGAFVVRKRSGAGSRIIEEPQAGLKIMQQKLLQVLDAVYEAPDEVHGFVRGRSIATNAFAHERAQEILNVDLSDFFGSVNFGRVRGLWRAEPYSLSHDAATVIAQLTTHDNHLPQGAPTSPILANMVARSLDRRMRRLATRRRLTYTRYADDLTFSGQHIPRAWCDGEIGSHPADVDVGGELLAAIRESGFEVNDSKTRVMRNGQRKLVTGLLVNEAVNVPKSFVRKIRARLHAWEAHGEQAAQDEWEDDRDRLPGKTPRFRDVVLGQLDHLSMVRGNDDPVYERYYQQYCQLSGASYIPVEDRAWNHLARPEDAVWVLECPTTGDQGTGFFLEGAGLRLMVTCEHVLGAATVAYPPKRPGLRMPVRVLARDKNIDLALLEVRRPFDRPLKPLWTPVPSAGDRVKVLGYPDYNPGSSIWLGENTISGSRVFAGVNRMTLNAPLQKGMSGGPVLDVRDRVVGVTATDANLYNSVVPIGQIVALASREGLL